MGFLLAGVLVVGQYLLTLQFQEAAKAASLVCAVSRRQDGGISAALTELQSGDWTLPYISVMGLGIWESCRHHPDARWDLLGMPNDRRVNTLLFVACVVVPVTLTSFLKSFCITTPMVWAMFVVNWVRWWKRLRLPQALLQILFLLGDVERLLGPLVRRHMPGLLTPPTLAKLHKI